MSFSLVLGPIPDCQILLSSPLHCNHNWHSGALCLSHIERHTPLTSKKMSGAHGCFNCGSCAWCSCCCHWNPLLFLHPSHFLNFFPLLIGACCLFPALLSLAGTWLGPHFFMLARLLVCPKESGFAIWSSCNEYLASTPFPHPTFFLHPSFLHPSSFFHSVCLSVAHGVGWGSYPIHTLYQENKHTPGLLHPSIASLPIYLVFFISLSPLHPTTIQATAHNSPTLFYPSLSCAWNVVSHICYSWSSSWIAPKLALLPGKWTLCALALTPALFSFLFSVPCCEMLICWITPHLCSLSSAATTVGSFSTWVPYY